jgi:hypothetical protein
MIKVLIALGFYLIVGFVLWRLKKFSKIYFEPFFIIIMVLGMICMIQPFSILVYAIGFAILLTGLAGYFITSHLPK